MLAASSVILVQSYFTTSSLFLDNSVAAALIFTASGKTLFPMSQISALPIVLAASVTTALMLTALLASLFVISQTLLVQPFASCVVPDSNESTTLS